MPVSSTNPRHADPAVPPPPTHTFTTASSNVGATKKRRSEADRNKTPSRQVLSQHTASSIRSATPSSSTSSGLFLTMEGLSTTTNTAAVVGAASSSVSPTTLLKQTGKDFEASRSAATRRVASTKTPMRTRHTSPPSVPSKPRALASRLVGGGKRRHSEAEEDIFGTHTANEDKQSTTTTNNNIGGRFSGGIRGNRSDDAAAEDDGDLRLLWERELSISSNVEKQQREESQQHFRNLLFAPRKSASTHHSDSGYMGRDADMSCSSFPGGISDPTTVTHNNNCNEIAELCRGATPTMRHTENGGGGGMGGGMSVSPISLFGAASPSPPVPYGCSGSTVFPPTMEAMDHYRQQSPFHRFAPPLSSFPASAARASSLASNATSINTVCARPATTTNTATRNNNSGRLFSPPPSLSARCTTPPAKVGCGRVAELDDEPLTESQYVTLNTGNNNITTTTTTRVRGARKTVARRKLNVVAEDSPAQEEGLSSVSRYLDFPSHMMDDDDDDVNENCSMRMGATQHTSCYHDDDDNVDPSLSLVMPLGGSQQQHQLSAGSCDQAKSSQSSHTTTATATTTPPHHSQDKVVWKAQANEWTSRTQAFFDELDQRPLHEVQPGATTHY